MHLDPFNKVPELNFCLCTSIAESYYTRDHIVGDDSAGLDHSPPQFVKILHDEVVEEGDSVTIECRNQHEDNHGMKTRAPEFTQKLQDQEVMDSLAPNLLIAHDVQLSATMLWWFSTFVGVSCIFCLITCR